MRINSSLIAYNFRSCRFPVFDSTMKLFLEFALISIPVFIAGFIIARRKSEEDESCQWNFLHPLEVEYHRCKCIHLESKVARLIAELDQSSIEIQQLLEENAQLRAENQKFVKPKVSSKSKNVDKKTDTMSKYFPLFYQFDLPYLWVIPFIVMLHCIWQFLYLI